MKTSGLGMMHLPGFLASVASFGVSVFYEEPQKGPGAKCHPRYTAVASAMLGYGG